MTVFEKIEAQQKGRENTPAWMVGEQLKEICTADPYCAELVEKDLDNVGMSIRKAEKKIEAWADDCHKKNKGNCVCVPPNVAERIIREFYGLPLEPATKAKAVQPVEPDTPAVLDLSSFF